MSRGNIYFPALATTMLVALLAPSLAQDDLAPPPLPIFNATTAMPPTPACLAKPMNCITDYLKNTDFFAADFDPTKPICCDEWSELIENDRQCYCDNAGPAIMTNATEVDSALKKCNIDASANTICQGIPSVDDKGAAVGPKWTGLVSGIMLLMAGLLLHQA